MKNKISKIFLAIFSIFLLVGGGIFSACEQQDPQATIEVSSSDFAGDDYIEIDLGSQSRVATITAKVTGISAGVVSVNNDYQDIIATSAVYDSKTESTLITVVGKSEGDAQIVLKSHGKGERTIRVYVYSDITSLDPSDSIEDQYVVRGQANTLYPDKLLKFGSREGGESNRKDVIWTLKTTDSNLSLDGNVLTVGEGYQSGNSEATIDVYADSVYVDKRATVTLNVISPLPDFSTYISRTSDAQGTELTEAGTSFNLVKNDDSNEEATLYARLIIPVGTSLQVTPNVYSANGENVTDKLDIPLFNSRTLSNSNEFIYAIKAKSHVGLPEELTVAFDVAYEKYSYKKESTRFVVSLVDVIDKIDVKSNGAAVTQNETINIYDYYNNDSSFQFGHPFLVSLGPDTVANSLAKYFVDITIPTGSAINGMIILSDQYGSPIRFTDKISSTSLGDTYRSEAIDNKTLVYLIAGNAYTNGEELGCTFISEQTERVSLSIKLRLYNSPKDNFDLDGGELEYYLATNKHDSKEVEVSSSSLVGIDAAGVQLDYVENDKIKLSNFKFDSENGKISFKVENNVLNFDESEAKLSVRIKHANGFVSKQTIEVLPFIPLETAYVNYRGQTTTAVSKTEYGKQNFASDDDYESEGDNTLTSIILKAGNSVEMSFNSNCNAAVSFKLVEAINWKDQTDEEKLGALIAADDAIAAGQTTIPNPLKNNGLLTMPSEAQKYYALVSFSGFDEDHNELILYRYFYLEGYIAPTRLIPDNESENIQLFAEDSISIDETASSRHRVTIKYRNDNLPVTYYQGQKDGDSLVEVATTSISGAINNYWKCVEGSLICTENLISFEIAALTTGGREYVNSQAVVSYSIFNMVYRAEINITIKNAQRVEKIVYTNKNPDDGLIYLDLYGESISDRTAVILTSVEPSNAYNKEVEYIFVANDGTRADLVSVSELGVVSIMEGAKAGGTGYIYVVPKDAIRNVGGVKAISYYENGSNQQTSFNLSDLSKVYDEIEEGSYYFEGKLQDDNSREKIYYNDVIFRIPITVADGASEETATRIYNVNQLASINPNRHYELMNSVELGETWTAISLDSGSLRGHNKNVTIAFNGGASLFSTIQTNKAKVRDLVLTGSVKGNGMLAEENNGQIINITVTVNSDESGKICTPEINGSENVGGIVGINNGTIENCAVEGAVITGSGEKNFVGGIAGKNLGTITGSRVEFYAIAENEVNTFKGYYVGGIVGYLMADEISKKGGSIENSYAYNYSSIYPLSGTTTGAFAGKALGWSEIDKEEGAIKSWIDTTIKNSFAVLVGNNSVTTTVAVGEDGEIVKIKKDEYHVNYANIRAAYWGYGSDFESLGNDSSFWITPTGENETNADFKSYVRNGEKHLKFYQAEALSDMDGFEVTDVKDSENNITRALKIGNDSVKSTRGILFISALKDSSSLTDSERVYLRAYNTISIEDLLKVSDVNKVVISSNSKDISIEGSNIILLNKTSEVKIKISSKYNFALSTEFTFKIVYAIDQFTALHDGIETSGFTLQETRADNIDFRIKDSIYLGNSGVAYEIQLEEFEIETSIGKVEDGQKNDVLDGKVTLTTDGMVASIKIANGTKDALEEQSKDSFKIYAQVSVMNLEGEYKEVIEKATQKTLQIYPTKGAQTIKVTTEALNIEPAYQSILNVVLATDDEADELLLSLKSGDVALTREGDVYSLNGQKILQISEARGKYDADNHQYLYELTISVHNDYKHKISSKEQYTLILASKTGTADNENREVTINLSTQMINNVDMSNYQMGATVWNNNVVTYTTTDTMISVISPGRTSIMKVSIDPTFAYYKYMTLTYQNADGASMGIRALKEVSGGYQVDGTAAQVEHGIKLLRNESGEFYFSLYAAQNISSDTTFNVIATFYGENNKPVLNSAIYDLYVSYLPEAEITVNGEISAIVAKGGSLDLEMLLKVDQEIESITASGVKGITISSRSSWTVENNGNGTKTIHAKLYAGLNAGVLSDNAYVNGEFQVEAVVSRVFNGAREEKRSSVYVTVVDLLPEKAEIRNATEKSGSSVKVLDSYIGIPLVVDFDYTFNPAEYGYDHSNAAEVAQFEKLNQARGSFQNDKYYYDRTTGFSINCDEEGNIIPIYQRIKIGNQKANFVRSSEEEGVWIFNYTKFRLSYNENTNVLTVLGLSSTAAPVNLTLIDTISLDSSGKAIKYEIETPFAIDVVTYSDPDLPLIIEDELGFLKVAEEGTAQNYILLNDITLKDYTPISANMFKMLDGNGHTINIESFNMEGSGTLNLALFSSIPSTTTIKNLKVNYYNGGKINVDTTSAGYSTINVAGLAINNAGTITNTQVIAYENADAEMTNSGDLGLQVNLLRGSTPYYIDDNSNVKAQIAGFVLSNTGSITNSRVGGDEIIVIGEKREANYTYYSNVALNQFVLSGQGDMAGFVLNNSGSIVASGASNIQITNFSTSTKTSTAGFIVTNNANIRTSYVEGSKDENAQTHYHLTGSNISARGTVAGFVVNNGEHGVIENAYSNILISSENETQSRATAGFVYSNEGKISYSYSASKVEKANALQTSFSGVDGNGNSLNEGKIELSYYYIEDYTDDSSEDIQTVIENQAARINKDAVDSENSYYGFIFSSSASTQDGIWEIDVDAKTGVKLICRDEVTISHRYYQSISGGGYVLPYSTLQNRENTAGTIYNTELGNDCNPILIGSANEFKEAMGESKSVYVQKFYNKEKVFGTYRFISDIALSDLNDELGNAEVSSIDKVFVGKLDGNGFTIGNISIKSSNDSVGLFGEINNGVVKNLNLEVDNITASDSYTVGALAGLAKDSVISNISFAQKSLSDEDSGKGVLGRNITGGIIGSVFGDSYITGLSAENVIVQSSYYDNPSSGNRIDVYLNNSGSFNPKDLRSKESQARAQFYSDRGIGGYSFAGAIIGYSDTYSSTEYSSTEFAYGQNLGDSQYAIKKLSVSGAIDVRGEVVGGVIGFTGAKTRAKDINIIVSKGDGMSNSILSYNGFAGAVVGYANGQFHQVYAEHDEKTQDKIESSTKDYYINGVDSTERGELELFKFKEATTGAYKYEPVYVGGLMGVMGSGAITVSYSKINAINYTKNGVAGGIAGLVKNLSTFNISVEALGASAVTSLYLNEVYTSGDVYAQGEFAGLFGQLYDTAPRITMMSVNAVNHYGIVGNGSKYKKYETGESSKGVYAIASNATSANVNVYPAVTATDGVAQEDLNSAKSFGYMSEYNPKDDNDAIKVIPYKGYNTEQNFFFKITAVTSFSSAENGYTETNGAFINSKSWDSDNWTHKNTELYPSINLINKLNYVYLDVYNAKSVVAKMANSSVEVRVRGKVSPNENQYQNVDLRDIIPEGGIKNFSGKLVGGTDSTWGTGFGPGTELINKGGVVESGYPGIIIDKTIFGSTGSGVTISNLNIIVRKKEDNSSSGSDGAISVTGGLISEQEILRGKFENVALYVEDKVKVGADSTTGNGGLLVPSAKSSSFKSIYFNFYYTENDGAVEITGAQNAGLITGQIVQASKYEAVKVQDITIRHYVTTNALYYILKTSGMKTTSREDTNVGLYVGKISDDGEGNVASVVLTAKAPEAHRNVTVESSQYISSAIVINADGDAADESTLNFGGYYGSVTSAQATLTFTKDKSYKQMLQLSNGIPTDSASLNEGGLIGDANLQGLTFLTSGEAASTESIKMIQTTLSFAKTQDNASVGSLFGTAKGNFTIENTKGGVESNIYTQYSSGQNNSNNMNISNGKIGGIIGTNEATIIINDMNVSLKAYNGDSEPESLLTARDVAKTQASSFVCANTTSIGGFIGHNTSSVTTAGTAGKLKFNADGENVAFTGNSNSIIYYGDFIGHNGGTATVSSFTSNAVAYLKASTVHAGGVIGYSQATADVAIGKPNAAGGELTGTALIINVTSNYFIDNPSTLSAGGMIGEIAASGSTSGSYAIQNTVFGGAFKVVNMQAAGAHNVGGIVGSIGESVSSVTITNNATYGDVIYTYSEGNHLSSYNFGGVVGSSQIEPTITGNLIAFTNNNSRIAYSSSSDDKYTFATETHAIVGNNSASGKEVNYYSSQLVLSTSDNATDLGYAKANANGYGTTDGSVTIISKFKDKLDGLVNFDGLAYGHKLRPIENGAVPSASTVAGKQQNLNGITYYTVKYPTSLTNNTLTNAAFVGDFDEKFASSGYTPIDVVGQHAFVSGVVVANDIPDTNTNTFGSSVGGIANELCDGIIFACKATGTLSVGGNEQINIGGIVGLMKTGRIAECYSAVDIVYRAASGGTAAGIAVTSDTDANGKTAINYIEKSYSTGVVGSYISANLYAFTNGSTNTYVYESYTISLISSKDHTTSNDPTGTLGIFGNAICDGCAYDKDATEYTGTANVGSGINSTDGIYVANASYEDGKIYKLKSGKLAGIDHLGEGWVADVKNNYGYERRNFGAFVSSSFKTIDNVDYYLVPNATKLYQMNNTTTPGSIMAYKLTHDINLANTSYETSNSSITIGGKEFETTIDISEKTFDGGGHTISNNMVTLFKTVATLKNLRVEGYMSGNSGITGAAVVAETVGTAENVIATGLLTAAGGKDCIGGLFGRGLISIKNCKNYVKIDAATTGMNAVGGIVGFAPATNLPENVKVSIEGCFNYASINVSVKAGVNVGGIVGSASGDDNANREITISNCGNENSVFNGYTSTTSNGNYYAAGIAGYLGKGTVSSCYNTGMIKAGNKNLNPNKNDGTAYAAGIVANKASGSVSNCINQGYVEALGDHSKATTSSVMTRGQTDAEKNEYTYHYVVTIIYNSSEITNVSARSIVGTLSENKFQEGNGYIPSGHINSGSIFNNGLYGSSVIVKDSTEQIPANADTGSENINDIYISSSDTLMCNGYDELGCPTSIFIKNVRTLKYGAKNSHVSKTQTRYSQVRTIPLANRYYNNSYYENSDYAIYKNKENSIGKIRQNDSVSSDISSTPYNISINGEAYAFVGNADQFSAVANNDYTTATISINMVGEKSISDLISAKYSEFTINEIKNNTADITNTNDVIAGKPTINNDGTALLVTLMYKNDIQLKNLKFTIGASFGAYEERFTLAASNIFINGTKIEIIDSVLNDYNILVGTKYIIENYEFVVDNENGEQKLVCDCKTESAANLALQALNGKSITVNVAAGQISGDAKVMLYNNYTTESSSLSFESAKDFEFDETADGETAKIYTSITKGFTFGLAGDQMVIGDDPDFDTPIKIASSPDVEEVDTLYQETIQYRIFGKIEKFSPSYIDEDKESASFNKLFEAKNISIDRVYDSDSYFAMYSHYNEDNKESEYMMITKGDAKYDEDTNVTSIDIIYVSTNSMYLLLCYQFPITFYYETPNKNSKNGVLPTFAYEQQLVESFTNGGKITYNYLVDQTVIPRVVISDQDEEQGALESSTGLITYRKVITSTIFNLADITIEKPSGTDDKHQSYWSALNDGAYSVVSENGQKYSAFFDTRSDSENKIDTILYSSPPQNKVEYSSSIAYAKKDIVKPSAAIYEKKLLLVEGENIITGSKGKITVGSTTYDYVIYESESGEEVVLLQDNKIQEGKVTINGLEYKVLTTDELSVGEIQLSFGEITYNGENGKIAIGNDIIEYQLKEGKVVFVYSDGENSQIAEVTLENNVGQFTYNGVQYTLTQVTKTTMLDDGNGNVMFIVELLNDRTLNHYEGIFINYSIPRQDIPVFTTLQNNTRAISYTFAISNVAEQISIFGEANEVTIGEIQLTSADKIYYGENGNISIGDDNVKYKLENGKIIFTVENGENTTATEVNNFGVFNYKQVDYQVEILKYYNIGTNQTIFNASKYNIDYFVSIEYDAISGEAKFSSSVQNYQTSDTLFKGAVVTKDIDLGVLNSLYVDLTLPISGNGYIISYYYSMVGKESNYGTLFNTINGDVKNLSFAGTIFDNIIRTASKNIGLLASDINKSLLCVNVYGSVSLGSTVNMASREEITRRINNNNYQVIIDEFGASILVENPKYVKYSLGANRYYKTALVGTIKNASSKYVINNFASYSFFNNKYSKFDKVNLEPTVIQSLVNNDDETKCMEINNYGTIIGANGYNNNSGQDVHIFMVHKKNVVSASNYGIIKAGDGGNGNDGISYAIDKIKDSKDESTQPYGGVVKSINSGKGQKSGEAYVYADNLTKYDKAQPSRNGVDGLEGNTAWGGMNLNKYKETKGRWDFTRVDSDHKGEWTRSAYTCAGSAGGAGSTTIGIKFKTKELEKCELADDSTTLYVQIKYGDHHPHFTGNNNGGYYNSLVYYPSEVELNTFIQTDGDIDWQGTNTHYYCYVYKNMTSAKVNGNEFKDGILQK